MEVAAVDAPLPADGTARPKNFVAEASGSLVHHPRDIAKRDSERKWADDFIHHHELGGFKRLGMHVGSGGTKNLALKRWPLGHYIELIQKLNRQRPDLAVVLFGGPDEGREHEEILAATDRKLVFRAQTGNLRQAAALLQRCDAFLSVDTALMHLAAAMRVPRQVVIETPTLNPTNLPYGNDFTVVPNAAVAGRQLEFYRYDGAGIKGTREELLRCMASVRPEAVYEALRSRLD